MLNLSIESAVTASSARRPSEKAASAPAEPATSETEVILQEIMTFWASWREERVGGMPSRETPLSARQGEDTRWSSRPDHQYPFQYGHLLPQILRKEKRHTLYSLKGRWNQRGTSTEASTLICSWSRNRTGVQICHQLKGPELIYKETNFNDGNVEGRFSEHQEMRLCGYNVRDSLLMKGAIEPARDEHRGFYSNLLLANKQAGVQICHQLKGPELIYKETNFHDSNVERRISEHQERRLGGYNRPEGRLLSRAYCEGHRRLIGFWWQGRSFQFRRLPFSSAPRIFTTISLPVVGMYRAKGIRLLAYLDDFLVLARNWRQLISHTSAVLDILDQAGFRQNLKKCHLQPRQKFKYLCLQWDSKELWVMLPADKITRFFWNRLSIEPPSEDGSNISRQLWAWVEYIFVPFRYRWKTG